MKKLNKVKKISPKKAYKEKETFYKPENIRIIEAIRAAIVILSLFYFPQIALASDPEPYWQGTLGPLNIRSLGPGQALRLAPVPRSPYGLPQGETELEFHIAVASVFLQTPGEYLIDFNFTDSRLAVNHGFANGWSAELSFNDRRIGNLYLDEVVKEFHDIFGIEQNGRDENMNETYIEFAQASVSLGSEANGVFSQTVGLSVQKVLIDKSIRWPALALIFNVSVETLANGMIEEGDIDYGVQLSIAQKYTSGYLFANLSYSWFGSNKALEVVDISDRQYTGMLGYEFNVKENEGFIVQYLFSEGVIEDLGALDDVSHEIHLGYKWRTEASIYEVGLVENIINFDNGPDVGFTFGITHRL